MQDELNEQIGRYSADDRLMMASAELARDAKKDRVEELIGFCNTHGIRTIGIARAQAKLTLANLAYNFDRLIFHERCAATG